MVKKVRKKKSRTEKDVSVIAPKEFSLQDHLDIPKEASKFELSLEKTRQNAKLVEKEAPQVKMTETIRSDEQIERFRDIYAQELEKRNICLWTAADSTPCLEKFTNPMQAIVHIRWHLALQDFDIKTARAAILDIEDRLFPTSERSTEIHLSLEERQKIVARQKQLLEAQTD